MSHIARHIHFQPWRGTAYGTDRTGRTARILLIGESHYSDGPEDSDFTQITIEKFLGGEWKGRFWTQICQTLTGKPHREVDRCRVWHSISFYNYVQEIVGSRPRMAPSKLMFQCSETAFWETVDLLEPTHLLVLGYRVWQNMPPLVDESLELSLSGRKHQYGQYVRGWGTSFAMAIKHPSSMGFSYQEWYPVVQKFLSLSHKEHPRAR